MGACDLSDACGVSCRARAESARLAMSRGQDALRPEAARCGRGEVVPPFPPGYGCAVKDQGRDSAAGRAVRVQACNTVGPRVGILRRGKPHTPARTTGARSAAADLSRS